MVSTWDGWRARQAIRKPWSREPAFSSRRAFPHMLTLPDGPAVAHGRHAIVLNVFTEPEWRRRGLAELLMRQVIAWAREERLDRLVLHASPQGRALYERLGFQGTDEMRFKGILRGFIGES